MSLTFELWQGSPYDFGIAGTPGPNSSPWPHGIWNASLSDYDIGSSPATFLGNITQMWEAGFTTLLNEPGSGMFKISAADPLAQTIWNNQDCIVRARLNTTNQYVFSFFIEDVDMILGSPTGPAAQYLNCQGRGIMAYLERAVLYPRAFPSGTNINYTSNNTTWAATSRSWISDTHGRGANTGNNVGIPALGVDYKDATDSSGAAWTSGNHVFNSRVGNNYLDLFTQVAALGPEVWCGIDTDLGASGTGRIRLRMFNQMGADRSGSVAFQFPGDFGFAEGGGSAQFELHRQVENAKSVVLVEGDNGSNAGNLAETISQSPAYWQTLGRRETYLSYPQAQASQSEMTAAGIATLSILSQETLPMQASVLHGTHGPTTHYEPFVDYFLGDYVTLNAPPFLNNSKYRIVGITLAALQGGDYDVMLNFNSYMMEAAIRLQQQIPGMIG